MSKEKCEHELTANGKLFMVTFGPLGYCRKCDQIIHTPRSLAKYGHDSDESFKELILGPEKSHE